MSPELLPWRRLGPPSRRPSTVVEWIIGISLVAIVAAFALPRIGYAMNERAASEVLRQVAVVQDAARRAAAREDWSALRDAPEGEIPGGLEAYLPEDATFEGGRWTLDWDLFEIRGRLRTLMVGDRHGGITVRLDQPGVADAVQRLAGRRLWLRIDDELSFMVPGLGPSPRP